ncbi:hypothetical protein [Pseudomonas fluorescens]|uniref:Bacterial Ig-like domain-containing protein n=1 Tax=Pseudomonas fluorescens TaxID=294 RepID=A0A5E7BM72_PSEFL|nr:hypothetical protein [Pseudomonas fluorescens]VVN85863.1 hypothetical protein PS710_01489 [Pseudomonas fluorescens]
MLDASDEDVDGQFNIPTRYSWRFTPSPPWEPGERQVTVKQIVSGVPSLPTELLTFKVRPPKPSMTAPTDPVVADYPLTVTGVYNDTAALSMLNEEGTEISGSFSPTGTTRTFTPAANWRPGTNTVKVVQTVNGQTSEPSDDCTFTVEKGDKPEAPQFKLPLAYTATSTRPTIRVSGLPHALITVRFADSEELRSEAADAEGNLEFRIEPPLEPGDKALQVKQKSNGPESIWSEPHPFTVRERPKKPVIDRPQHGANVSRTPAIDGKGETRGQILLRHEDDPETVFATINGVRSWSWKATEKWNIGPYAIQARQTEDGDDSDWTEPRSFKVVDALYGIDDAGPVLGQPVVGTGQSVLLRVQISSGDTGEVAEGVQVEWRIEGEPDVIATTETDPRGWARYTYTPDTTGEHQVVADITNANQGVVMTQLFEVTALSDDAWAQEAGLYLDDQLVDLAKEDLVLLSGKSHELELRINSGSLLIGSSVTLLDLWGAAELGLDMVPQPGVPQRVEEGKPVRWSISFDSQESGFFGLNLTSPVLPDWQLPGRLEAGDFAEAVDVDFDSFPMVFGGEPAYPCRGAMHTFTVRPKPASPLLGMDVKLDWLGEAAPILGVSVSPDLKDVQRLGPDGFTWTLNCVDSLKNGRFSLRLSIPELDFNSLDLTMSFGHNLVTAERWSQVIEGPGEPWTLYGLRATSTFLNQPAPGVQVIIQRSNTDTPFYETTNAAGEVVVNAYNGTSLSMKIHNGYDGTIV